MTNTIEKNIAVIGCGHWGKNLVRNYHELGALAAVCDYNKDIAEEFAEKYDVPSLSVDEIINSADIKGVVIAAPAALHYELAKKALKNNKDVFVEKPLSLSVVEGQEICALAKENNKILMVGHLLHYHSAYQKLRSLVSDGTLGDLRYVYSNRLNLGKIRREEDILWSFAPHDVSMILDLMQAEPIKIDAKGAFHLSENIADVTTTHLSFSGNRKAHIFVSWLHPYKEQRLVVVGSKAMAVFEDGLDWNEKLKLYRHDVQITDENAVPLVKKADCENVEIETSEPLKNECLHFIECIQTRKKPKTDGEEGLRVLNVLEKATQSIETAEKKAAA